MSKHIVKMIWLIVLATGLVISAAYISFMLFDLYVNYNGRECSLSSGVCVTTGSILQGALYVLFFTIFFGAMLNTILELMYLFHAKQNHIKDYHFNRNSFSINIIIVILLSILCLSYIAYDSYRQCYQDGVNLCNTIP